MKRHLRRSFINHRALKIGATSLVLASLLLGVLAFVSFAEPTAAITLTLAPGASVALLPGEMETITWEIVPSEGRTPLRVDMRIIDQDGVVLASETYPDDTGLSVTYYYTLPTDYVKPDDLPFERYRVEITYISTIGEEYGAWGVFIVDDERGGLHIFKFDDRNLNGVFDGVDVPVEGVLIGVQFPPPFEDTVLYEQTNAAGEVDYPMIATAAYTVTEHVPAGKRATTPDVVSATVLADSTTTVEFGNATIPGTLRVFKFRDDNGSGVQDAGEPPLQGVHVEASSPCGQAMSGETDQDGYIVWDDRCVDTWTVTETVPTNSEATTPATVITFVQSQQTTEVIFGNRHLGALEILKFEDQNGDGVQGIDEPPWPGVTINWENEWGETGSCMTNVDGLCLLTDLPVGDYTITEVLPPNSAVVGDVEQTVTVRWGVTATVVFANRKLGNLEILKFEDKNGNGVQDAGEPPWPGVTINWVNEWGISGFCITDVDGLCTLTDIPIGVYTVTEILPPNSSVATDVRQQVTVVWGETATVEFPNRKLGALEILKFEDLNGNGVQDADEPPWPGVTINWVNEWDETGSCVTDINGLCILTDLPVGDYRVTEILPPSSGAVSDIEQFVTITWGETAYLEFFNRKLGGLEILKFEDKNGNGVQDAGEPPWPGVTINWENEWGETDSCTTNAQGLCVFTDLPVGDYTITEIPPPDSAVVGDVEQDVSVTWGETTMVEFANRWLGNLEAYVFFDRDGNGIEDDGWDQDLPWSGANLSWINEYGESDSGLTDITGEFTWVDIGIGDYTVSVTVPHRCELTTANDVDAIVPTGGTARVRFGLRCMLYLPLLLRDYPPPTPTPTFTPTPTPTFTPTNTPTPTVTPTPTNTPTATPTPPPPIIHIPHPKGIAIDEARNRLYIASKTTNQLYEVDGGTNSVLRQVAVGSEPYGVAFNKATGKIYVANYADGTVSVVDAGALAVLKTIDMGSGSEPAQVAVNSLTNRIYVTLHGAGQLAVIDGASDQVLVKLGMYSGPFGVVADETLNLVYMSTRDSGFVAVFDGATNTEIVERRTFVGGLPYSIALDPVLKRFYVVYAPNSLLANADFALPLYLPLPSALLAGDPNVVAIFEVKPTEFGRLPDRTAGPAGDQGGVGIAANPSTDNFFVSNAAGDSLTVFDGLSLSSPATLAMPGNPGEVAVNSTLNRVYVSNRSADVVYMVVDLW